MKFFRLDLLTLLISLFILNSCKNQDSVGFAAHGTNQISGSLVDTSTIIINTVPEDSVITSGLQKNPLSFFKDVIYGTTVSNLATDINLPGNAAYTLPSGTIIIDSARLVLKYADGFYGDISESLYTINVYQLNEKFNTTTTYYNDKTWNYNSSNLIGSTSQMKPPFVPRPHDSLTIAAIVTGGPDSTMRVPPQVRIPISSDFVNKVLFNANGQTLSSNAIFQNVNKGLYITIDQNKSSGPGGTLMFAPSDSLAVYYRTLNGSVIDTAVVYMPITNFAANITHSYTATVQAAIKAGHDSPNTSANTFYLQGLGGLRAKIAFPNFLVNLRNSLLKKDSDIVLNRAELVISPQPGSTNPLSTYTPISKITMYKLDIAGQRTQLADATGDPRSFGVGTFGGFYNANPPPPNSPGYHFVITAHLQDLMLGKNIDYGTFIAPVDTTNTNSVDIAATPQVAARTVGVGSDKSQTVQIRLNVIYTKVATSKH